MRLLRGFFTVPNDVPDMRVKANMPDFIRRYVETYTKDGWRLKSKVVTGKMMTPLTGDITNGESRWYIIAYWERAPFKQTFEVDEKHIPGLIATGKFQLA